MIKSRWDLPGCDVSPEAELKGDSIPCEVDGASGRGGNGLVTRIGDKEIFRIHLHGAVARALFGGAVK